jgi:hypothetical protein
MTAITNLGTLKAAVGVETQRTGVTEFTAALPRFVQTAEEMIYIGTAATDPVRVEAMETSSDLTFVAGIATRPSDFLQSIRLYWQSDLNIVPRFVGPSDFYEQRNQSAGYGFAQFYTVEGSSVLISPASTGTGKLRYYARPAALSADADTNWTLANASNMFYAAVCAEAFRYLRNSEKASEHLVAFRSAVAALERYTERQKIGGRSLYPFIRQPR